jgi:predicted ATPase
MYVKSVRIKNFMVHQDTRVDLLPLTVFVGPNGGGKSAFFDALLNFSMLSRGNLRQAFGPYPYSFNATLFRGAQKLSKIGYEMCLSRGPEEAASLAYEITYAQSGRSDDEPHFTIYAEKLTLKPEGTVLFDRAEPELYPLAEGLSLQNDRSVFAALRQKHLAGELSNVDELVGYCVQRISRFNKFRLDPAVLAAPSRLPDTGTGEVLPQAPRVGYHGEDLASTLYFLNETSAPEVERIRTELREVDAAFSDFEFNAVGTDRIAFSLVYSDRRGAVPSVRLSAGNLIYLGLITLVSTPNRPPVMMIEEPENGLTPQAVKSFYKAVRQLAYNTDPAQRSQVMISSHSPFVICEAWNGEDRDFIHQVKVQDGRAVIRKFSTVVEEQKIMLAKDPTGKRTHLSLTNAEEMMSGYLS